jgi:hypothetical protein
MRQILRVLIVGGVLVALLVALATGSPAALAQSTPVADEAEAKPPVSAECDDTSEATLQTEVVPPGVVREMLMTTPIDSTGFAGEDPDTGEEIPALLGVTSIVCVAPNTEVEIEVEGAPNTTRISQHYTATLLVLEGTIELMVVEGCALPLDGGSCEVTDGTATFHTADDRTTEQSISDADFTSIPAGSIVVLADVTIATRTGETGARLLTTGVAADPTGGGACPSGCGRWKYP